MNPSLVLFGQKLNLVRLYLGRCKRVSQGELARLTLVNQCDISRLENGLDEPKYGFLERLSHVTGVPIEYYFGGKSYGDFMRLLADIDGD